MSVPLKLMPVQTKRQYDRTPSTVRQSVALRAYEVYCEVHGPQEAIVTGDCRGDFGTGELVAFLYARSFPREEWRMRVSEALVGLNV